MSAPKVAFCITCKGRAQHIEQTLPRNLKDNACYTECRFVVLDYNSPDHLLGYLQSEHAAEIESGRLAVYSHREPGPFRMAHAKNMAHRLGMLEGADVLVNLDADNFTGPGFAEYVAAAIDGGNRFLWARMIQDGTMLRGISGRIAVTAKAFVTSGGYDERFATWSPDDKDLCLRLGRMGYTAVEIEPRYLSAVAHSEKMRFKEYPQVRTKAGEESFVTVDDIDTTIANYGRIGCGIVNRIAVPSVSEDSFDTSMTELKPLPTRVFGIGMHKTATTSLHTALSILGFDSAHWKSAHWAKAIWEEMTTWGRSRTLERHYAVCDLPMPLLYRQLDAAYPGSKFILTVRGEDRWIASVRNHWSTEHNRFRASWNTDPFSHRVHQLTYGRRDFDEETFRARYQRHNAEVRAYFSGRPNDLLVMDMDHGRRWDALCSFLGQPVPEVEYPRAYVTKERP